MKDKKLENLLNDLKKETFNGDLDAFDNKVAVQEEQNKEEIVSKYDFTIKHNNNEHSHAKFNVIWSENKETLLFSLLSSIIVIVIGLISYYDYLVMFGAFSFMLFSILVFITFFRYVFVSYHRAKIPENILNRVSLVEKKIDFLSKKDISVSASVKTSKIEEEINEIRAVLKTVLSSFKK